MDELKIYRGDDYQLNSFIRIHQPTLGEICDYGEHLYLQMVRLICSTPADRKVEIWDELHVYWEQVDEFELFMSIITSLPKERSQIIFGDFDFTAFRKSYNPEIGMWVLRRPDGAVIDRSVYTLLTDFLRKIHRFEKNVDIGYNDATRDIMIEDDRDAMMAWKNKPAPSFLLPLISSLTNCPEFKYRHDDVWGMPIYAFFDAAARLQKHKNYEHLMHGVYSGTVELKKLNKRELNWMGELK